ncbi:MAG: hypothetical protein NC084_09550 [Bacteroides sp.]|nr:hypothetical protein [Bacteroides sp.]
MNGKDKKTSDGSYDGYYKFRVFQFVGKTLGGKLQAAVVPEDFDVTSDLPRYLQNGKISPSITKRASEIATAKIDAYGKVTVTAKKKAGEVQVVVYEVNDKKQLVCLDDGGLGEKYEIYPVEAYVGVEMAPSGITYTTDISKLQWMEEGYGSTLKSSDKGGITLAPGDTAIVYLADKKTGVSPSDLTYLVDDDFDTSIATIPLVHYNELIDGEYLSGYGVYLSDLYTGKSDQLSDELQALKTEKEEKESELRALTTDEDKEKKEALTAEINDLDTQIFVKESECTAYETANKSDQAPDKNKYVSCIEIVAERVGKTTVTVNSPISGKKLKIKVTVKANAEE